MARESFKRYVEVGRVVLLLNGENKNKIAVIAEIIDQNKVRFRQRRVAAVYLFVVRNWAHHGALVRPLRLVPHAQQCL